MAANTGDLDRMSATERVNEDSHGELYTKTATMLADLSNDADPAELVEADKDTENAKVDAEKQAEEVGDSPVADPATDDASSDEDQSDTGDDTKEQEAAADAPTLPAAIRRSLKSYEWTDAEIDEAFKRDPEGFLPTASKIHATRVRETQEWAALGRARRDEETDAAAARASSASEILQPDPNIVIPDGGIAPLDFDQLALDSGFDKETLIKAFGPVSTIIDAVNKVLPALNEGVETVERNRQAEVARQVDQFFQSDELTPFSEFYGKSWDSANDDQIGQRNNVLELADHMIVGANHHGRKLSAFDAMELAHHTVASDVKDSVIRQTLAKQVETRRKGITLKPTSKTTSSPNEAPDRAQILANAAERLRKVFG